MKHASRQISSIRASIFVLLAGVFLVVICSCESLSDPSECLSTATSAGQAIEWNYDGMATIEGTGCNALDTMLVPAGNQMSIVFTNLGVNLADTADGKMIDQKTCRITVPVKLKAGWYIENLYHTLTYGYSRSEGTDAEVVVESWLFGNSAGRIRRSIPTPNYDPFDVTVINAIEKNTFWADWCSQSDTIGVYEVELTINGFRESLPKAITTQIDALILDVRPPLGDT